MRVPPNPIEPPNNESPLVAEMAPPKPDGNDVGHHHVEVGPSPVPQRADKRVAAEQREGPLEGGEAQQVARGA